MPSLLALALAGMALGAITLILVPSAAGGAIPDSGQMATLRASATKAPVLLVRGDFGLQEIHDPLLDSAGVRSATWESQGHKRPAVFSTAEATPAPVARTIAWSEISTIHSQHQKKLQGAVAGFVAGLAVGLTVYAATNPGDKNTGEDYSGVGWVLGTPVLGTVAGFIIGSFTGTRLVYPQPIQENH